jgi:alcohol dehydrogenase
MKIETEDSKIALVTGASSGIGEATAERLAMARYKVYGTSRRGAQAGQRSFAMLPLDVTSDDSVEAAVRELMHLEGRIDLLVNNAGFGVAPAGAEESSLEQAQSIFDTNFFGTVRMTRAVVPHMRRQGSGRIINIGSVLGVLPMPYGALYAATKHAVEGYSESLDHELRTRGIRVSVIEPAYTKTQFDANFLEPDSKLDEYRPIRAALEKTLKEVMATADPPGIVADVVLEAATAERPKLRYAAGGRANRLRLLRRFAPAALIDTGIREGFAARGVARGEQDMKAFIVDRYSKNDPMRLGEVPEPKLRDDDVLIQVNAAGVNLLDSKIKSGEFKLILPYRMPLVLGHDVAGVVSRIGSRVRRFKIGDEVYSRPPDHRVGTFAEFIAVNEDDVAPKPKNLTMQEAASIPLVGLTAWQALIERAYLKRGEKVLIQAGSGGVGTFAIQLAKHIGAMVATTTSGTNFDLVKSLGADIVIDYRKDDFGRVLQDYDVILHSQDAAALEKSLRVLKPGGTLISISGPPDPAFAKGVGAPWFVSVIVRLMSSGVRKKAARRALRYSFLFMHANGHQLHEITRLIDARAIRPVVDRVFPFESTNEALAYVETGRAKGKVVVNIK